MSQLSDLASPALFERFIAVGGFDDFVADMKGGRIAGYSMTNPCCCACWRQ